MSAFHGNTLEILHWEDCPAVESHPDRLSGVLVFAGTRVPISSLFNNLQDGATIDDFLEWFPGVERQKVKAVLGHLAKVLDQPVVE